jgi:hypothetical protein
MSGMWKRSHGRTSEAPPDERGGYRYVRPTATASHLDSTHLSRSRSLRRTSANSYVRSQGTRQRLSVPTDSGSVSRNCNWLHRVGDGALRRRSIKLLFAGSAFRVSVSGLVLCLNGGRRAQPGHVVRDRGSPPWLHPRRCAALRFLLSTASTAGSSDGCDLSRAPRRSRPSRVSSGPQGVGLYRGGALEHAG